MKRQNSYSNHKSFFWTIIIKRLLTLILMLLCFTTASTAQFTLVKDIYFSGSSNPECLVKCSNFFMFFATTPATGTELFRSDGTDAGTYLVKDINPGPTSAIDGNMIGSFGLQNAGKIVFFAADDGIHGQELWVSDGTSSGTHMVKDITKGSGGTYLACRSNEPDHPLGLTDNGLIFFLAQTSANSVYFFRSDGTASGTYILSGLDCESGTADMSRGPIFKYNNKYYFSFYDDLYQTNGTDTLTLVKKGLGRMSSILLFNNNMYYTITGYQGYGKPYKNGTLNMTSDGFNSSTVIKQFSGAGQGASGPYSSFYPAGKKFYFAANLISYNNQLGGDIWVSDGTAAGTTLVKTYLDYYKLSIRPTIIGTYKNDLYYEAYNANTGIELNHTDGTTAGIQLLKDLNYGTGNSNIENMVVFRDSLFLIANNNFYKSDGTDSGTVLVSNKINCGTYSTFDKDLVNAGDTMLLFTGCYYRSPTVTDNELYRYGGISKPTGISNSQNYRTAFHVYPNPAKNFITISVSGETEQKGFVRLINSQGAAVYFQNINFGPGTTHQIPLHNLPAGIYFLILDNQGINYQEKIIVQ